VVLSKHNVKCGGIGRCIILLALLVAGCSPQKAPSPDAALPQAIPPRLTGARLLFHRPDGLYRMTLGGAGSHRIHPDGTYGRWAPDGRSLAFIAGNQIMWHDLETGVSRALANVTTPGALAFHPDGRQILFTDGDTIRSVRHDTGAVHTILTGPTFVELDVAADGSFLATTVKRFGYRVMRWNLADGTSHDFGRGCSASISPDTRWITVNALDHLQLMLHASNGQGTARPLRSPVEVPLDNQKWSNHPDWIAGIIETPAKDIMVQSVPEGQIWRLTDLGDADRPDLFIPPAPDNLP